MLIIILLSIIAIVAMILISSYIFSGIVMYSRRQPIVRTPKEYGMAYEDVEFKSTDNLTLKGWFIPGRLGHDNGWKRGEIAWPRLMLAGSRIQNLRCLD